MKALEFNLKLAMFFVIGMWLLVILGGRVALATYTLCWKEVQEPFLNIHKFRLGGTVEAILNPMCLEKLYITDEEDKCKAACAKDEDCAKKCVSDDVRTFFVVVKKEEGWVSKLGRWATNPVEAFKSHFEENDVHNLPCRLDSSTGFREYRPGEDKECVKLKINNEVAGVCKIENLGKC
jgi:hypothetical protein